MIPFCCLKEKEIERMPKISLVQIQRIGAMSNVSTIGHQCRCFMWGVGTFFILPFSQEWWAFATAV